MTRLYSDLGWPPPLLGNFVIELRWPRSIRYCFLLFLSNRHKMWLSWRAQNAAGGGHRRRGRRGRSAQSGGVQRPAIGHGLLQVRTLCLPCLRKEEPSGALAAIANRVRVTFRHHEHTTGCHAKHGPIDLNVHGAFQNDKCLQREEGVVRLFILG